MRPRPQRPKMTDGDLERRRHQAAIDAVLAHPVKSRVRGSIMQMVSTWLAQNPEDAEVFQGLVTAALLGQVSAANRSAAKARNGLTATLALFLYKKKNLDARTTIALERQLAEAIGTEGICEIERKVLETLAKSDVKAMKLRRKKRGNPGSR